jgi:tetratricopeptide (TPR) repeat protein
MSHFHRSLWNELQGLTPQEIEIIKRFEKDSRGTLFVAAADIVRKRGYIDEAIVIMEDGIKLFPQYHTARASLGRDYFLKGMMNEADKHISLVIQKSADNPIAQRLKLKLDILLNNKSDASERLAILKQVVPDDEFTKAVRDLLSLGDWEGTRALMRAELDRLNIQWSVESESEATNAALERLQAATSASENSAWEIPSETAPNTVFATKEIEQPVAQFEYGSFEESHLPTALRTGPTLAHIRGDDERYLVLKGFRRVQAEGLFSNTQTEVQRRQSLDNETLAEIYATQGLIAKSITIYERLVRSMPENSAFKDRLSELQTALKNQGLQANREIKDANSPREKAHRMNAEQEKKLQLLERLLTKLEGTSERKTTSMES